MEWLSGQLIFRLGAGFTLYYWVLLVAFSVFQIRFHLFSVLYGSFGYSKKSKKQAFAARKEQTLLHRFTFTYIKDYVSDRLRKLYTVYMVLKVFIDIWIILSGLFLIAVAIFDIPYATQIKGIFAAGFIVVNTLLFAQYNPLTKYPRCINFMFPNR